MLEAPRIEIIKKHKDTYPNALCCIVFAPNFHNVGYEGIIERFGYLDNRSAEDIHFYCAGYGAYWSLDCFPDMKLVNVQKYQDGYPIP